MILNRICTLSCPTISDYPTVAGIHHTLQDERSYKKIQFWSSPPLSLFRFPLLQQQLLSAKASKCINMMMMTMGHCCRASTFLLACCSLLLCFWPHHEVFARVTIPRRRRTTAAAAANIFNGTQVGAYEGSSQLLLPAWATMEEEEDLQANRGNPRLGQSSLALNKQLIFQQQAAGQQQLPLRIPAEYEPVSTGTSRHTYNTSVYTSSYVLW